MFFKTQQKSNCWKNLNLVWLRFFLFYIRKELLRSITRSFLTNYLITRLLPHSLFKDLEKWQYIFSVKFAINLLLKIIRVFSMILVTHRFIVNVIKWTSEHINFYKMRKIPYGSASFVLRIFYRHLQTRMYGFKRI